MMTLDVASFMNPSYISVAVGAIVQGLINLLISVSFHPKL